MRRFGVGTAAVVVVMGVLVILSVSGIAGAQDNQSASTYSFVYLGDLHFDKKAHHDLEWVKASHPGDVRQIEDYVRNTQEYTPGLLQRIQTAITSSEGRIKLVVQGGDLTEGLCGSRELQETQFRDAAELIRRFIPKTPFLAAKGNHDVTGPGAREAFDRVMLPWLARECGKPVESASFCFSQGPDLFIFFDAYHNHDLDWLEKTLRDNPHRHAFVVMHPPAVPYDARSTWHLFSRDNEQAVRERFLNILGANRVVLLTGHLHKYGLVVRRASTGAFVQFGMNSVISSAHVSVKNHLEGVENYGGRLLELEPDFQPETLEQRRTLLEREKPHIARFEYAELAGYAILHVSDTGVSAEIYLGDSEKPWKTVPLTPGLEN